MRIGRDTERSRGSALGWRGPAGLGWWMKMTHLQLDQVIRWVWVVFSRYVCIGRPDRLSCREWAWVLGEGVGVEV